MRGAPDVTIDAQLSCPTESDRILDLICRVIAATLRLSAGTSGDLPKMRMFFSRRYAVEWLLIAGIFWFSMDQFILGKYSWMRLIDNGNVSVPSLMANGLRGFDGPLWHVFSTAGNDGLATGYFGWLDTFLFQALPGWLALQLRTVSQVVFAALGVYALCRRSLSLDKLASAVPALFVAQYASGAQMLISVDAYLPMSILAVSLVLDQPRDWKRWLFWGALAVLNAHSLLSRPIPHALLVHVLWFAFVERRRSILDWGIILGFGLFTVLVRAQDFFAVALYGKLSDRHVADVPYDLSFRSNARHIISYYFGWSPRILVTVLVGYGLVAWRGRYAAFGRLMTAFAVGLALVMALPAIKPLAIELVPVTATFKLTRFYKFLFPFAAMGAGFGVQALLELARSESADMRDGLWRRIKKWAPGLVVALFLAMTLPGKYRHVVSWVSEGNYVLNFESPVLGELADNIHRRGEPVRAVSFQLYPNSPHVYGIETAGGFQVLQIRRYTQFWMRMVAAGRVAAPPADLADRMYLVVNPAEHRPEWKLAELYDLELLALANVRYVISRDRLVDPSLILIQGPATPWSALSVREKIQSNLRANFTGRTHLYVYEYTDALPRFYIPRRLRVLATGDAVLDAMAVAERGQLAKTIFVEAAALPTGLDEKTSWARGTVRVEHYSGDEIRLAVDLDGAALLFAGNAYSPYWKAYVDGREATIFPANHAFWGVALPATARQVIFRYEPPYRLF